MKKIIVQYYVFSALMTFFAMSLASGIYVSYLIKNGLDLLQVNLVNTSFFLTLFICEIPTGAFADVFGRKNSFTVACVLLGIGKIVYGFTSGIWGFIFAEIILAVGKTFYSGAFEAWFTDSMKHHGYDGSMTKYFARETIICQITSLVAAIVGSYMYAYRIEFPWIAGGTAMLIVALFSHILLKEDYWERKKISFLGGFVMMKKATVSSFKYGMNSAPVRVVMTISLVQSFSAQALNMFWQPRLGEMGLPDMYLGHFFAGIMIAVTVGSVLISKVDTENRERRYMVYAQVITGLLVILMSQVTGLVLLSTILFLHEIPRGVMKPLVSGYLQSRIPSEERATISSFAFISSHIGGAVGLVVSGFIAKYYGVSTAWMMSGLIFAIGGVLIARNGHK